MQVTLTNGTLAVAAENYHLLILADRPFVYLTAKNGEPLATLFVLSAVHPLHGRDDTTAIGQWTVTEEGNGITLSLTAASSTWSEKRYRFRCYPERFTYEIEVVGDGHAPSIPPHAKPTWWQEPIFCGWGSQCHLARAENGRAPDYARQTIYEQFLAILQANEICPGTIVLDDKWQATYGKNEVDQAKWPDLRGFIGRQHAAGRKLLLWLKAWDPEGVPAAECIQNAAGLPIAIDPTNPAFQQRLRRSVQRMLSPAGYDADGFKIDFTARIPSGPGLKRHGDAWGLELLKQYLGLIHTAAKEIKPDALIMTHTPHPYLADVVDMIRLNDINVEKDVNQAMRHRACIARIACPAALIDTDNWSVTNRAAGRVLQYARFAEEVDADAILEACSSVGEVVEQAQPLLSIPILLCY